VAEATSAPPSVTPERLNSESQALVVVDDAGVCVEASFGACRLLGAARAEVVGRSIEDLLEPGSRERFNHLWPAFRVGGGQGEPFALEAPASMLEVAISVTAAVLPDRHLVAFERAGDRGEPAELVDPPEPGPEVQRVPTSRERQVLELLADGATDAQIATRLELAPATVQTHVRNAKAKLGARTRAQAVALAIQFGLIEV
jgi:DNA-binding CsgD family transcriptional regulator